MKPPGYRRVLGVCGGPRLPWTGASSASIIQEFAADYPALPFEKGISIFLESGTSDDRLISFSNSRFLERKLSTDFKNASRRSLSRLNGLVSHMAAWSAIHSAFVLGLHYRRPAAFWSYWRLPHVPR